MAFAAGCEVSPLLFSCCRRAVGRSKRQSCRVTTYGSCYEKIGPERLNETVSFTFRNAFLLGQTYRTRQL